MKMTATSGILLLATLLMLMCWNGPVAADPVDFFFYPPPYEFPNGEIVSEVVTLNVKQSTVLFPKIKEMAGIVLLVNWSTLCPEENRCDWSLIDQVLDYWKTAGKKVILGVPAVNYPIQVPYSDGDRIESATPAWLLNKVETYRMPVNLIVPIRPLTPARKMSTMLPVYWDPQFIHAKQNLVAELARRYDGHPAISKIRIDTGIVTEDNPTFDGLHTVLPGWYPIRWVEYCNRMVDIYHSAFHKTQLEFDIDRMGFISALGTPKEKAAADQFMHKLESLGIFLAMDGFDTVNIEDWRSGKRSGPSHSLEYLVERHSHADAVGVEGAPLYNPRLEDVKSLAKAVKEIGATRFVLFAEFPGLVSVERDGVTESNQIWNKLINGPMRKTLVEHSEYLLEQLH